MQESKGEEMTDRIANALESLVEAQREANEIARIQVMLALPGTPEQMREAPVDEQGRERMERVLKGLGL